MIFRPVKERILFHCRFIHFINKFIYKAPNS
nr:MAG TPA: hypothetical protein [Crassvirales sp.]